ncbi:MAG: hypothetical protein ABT940_04685 [Alphaproteobacteria bacterium]
MHIFKDLQHHESVSNIVSNYASIISAIVIPLVIGFATSSYNKHSAELNCIKQSVALSEKLYQQPSEEVDDSDSRAKTVTIHAGMLADSCAKVGMLLPKPMREKALVDMFLSTSDPAVAEMAKAALETSARVAAAAEDPVDREAARNERKAVDSIPPRVYFHVANLNQKAEAQKLGEKLMQVSLNGDHVVVPGVGIRSGVSVNEIRCFRKEECVEAEILRKELNGFLEQPEIALKDMHAVYKKAPNIRPRHYELWLSTGDIKLK